MFKTFNHVLADLKSPIYIELLQRTVINKLNITPLEILLRNPFRVTTVLGTICVRFDSKKTSYRGPKMETLVPVLARKTLAFSNEVSN